jgi:hypothetical protein
VLPAPLLPMPLVGSLAAVYRPLLLPESVESHPARYARQNRQSRSTRCADNIFRRPVVSEDFPVRPRPKGYKVMPALKRSDLVNRITK